MHSRGQTGKTVCDSTSAERIENSNGKWIRRDDYVDEVKSAMAMSRGRELPGTFNPLVVGDLFRDQCRNWGRLADECAESVLQSCFAAVAATLRHITVQDTAEKILQSRINPAMAALKKDMADATARLLVSNVTGHPVMYNHYLTETVQKVQNDRLRASLNNILRRYSHDDDTPGQDAARHRARHAARRRLNTIDYMEAYYKVALKSFVDNVSVLVVEQCLLSKLTGLFTPDTIYAIADDDIRHLAGENPEATAERARLVEKKTCLEACENELRRLDKHRVPATDEAEDDPMPPWSSVGTDTNVDEVPPPDPENFEIVGLPEPEPEKEPERSACGESSLAEPAIVEPDHSADCIDFWGPNSSTSHLKKKRKAERLAKASPVNTVRQYPV
ncbi:uncharacterized protein SPSK_09305 [Sporothrix schenckii 1099-18]|uniref:GED domain-containing protein n=1 Tax=Sporothrix schenckii 1099-18 TaxID=1397361 RepID=A0A0F2M7H8_SPOSC|nr:uncharacterized protein SPSK_09305 [Sporothrix schenckii 1099-18]KJR84131.1 hypothetical protein SPSK_09305 [Sporothrix schenckii 1099-18]